MLQNCQKLAIWMENLWILDQKQKTEKKISYVLFQFSVNISFTDFFLSKSGYFFTFALNLNRIFYSTHGLHFWPKIKQLYVTIFLKNWHFYHFLSEDFLRFCVTFGVYIIYGYVLHFWNKIQLLLVLRFSITIRIFTVLSKIQRFYIQIAIFWLFSIKPH